MPHTPSRRRAGLAAALVLAPLAIATLPAAANAQATAGSTRTVRVAKRSCGNPRVTG